MIVFKGARSAVCLAAIVAGSTAFAEVTAQQVWDNWKDQLDLYGEGGVTIGSETMSGSTLTVSDLSIQMSDPEANITATLDEIQLSEMGDGTVSITMSDTYPMTVTFTPTSGDPTTLNIVARNEGMSVIVSGTPDVMEYALNAPSYVIALEGIAGDGADEIDINGTFADVTAQAKIALPIDMDMDAPETAFIDGLSIAGGYSFGATSYDFAIDADGEQADGAASIEGGSLTVAMDIDGLLYQGETRGLNVLLNIPGELPFPVEAQLGAYGFAMEVPLSSADEPRDFALSLNIADLAVSNGIWNMVDPGEILPRDPATASFALSGTATPFFDLLDPEQAQAAAMSDIPGELNSLSLDSLKLAIAGALITGDGSFTFDNDDLATFDGFPRPEGALELSINGVNGLIDKLIQMGLLPEEQAMGGRMMLGMFATPVGDDMLTSTIEVNSEGHVLANGQRLR